MKLCKPFQCISACSGTRYHLVLPVMHVVSGGIMPIGTYLIVLPVILAVFGGE